MAKTEQILNIDPQQELKFVGPYNNVSSTYLKLSNPTDNHVLFKIKTTAPKKYCVRPNAGHVVPYETILVQVCLQPYVVEPNEKNKHKFMVQTLLWNPKSELSQEDAWRNAKPEQLMDTKLKCVFELPSTTESPAAKKNTSSSNSPPPDADNTRYVGGDTSNNDVEVLQNKARKEVENLLDGEGVLRDENQALKEELRLMRNKMAAQSSSDWSQMQNQQGFQTPLIIVAILAGLVGIVLGKFLL